MSRKRDVPPALILVNEDEIENISKFNAIDSPQYLIGRSLDANLIILQKCISRRHCSIKFDEKTNLCTITSHVKAKKAVVVDGKELKCDESLELKCGAKINVTPYFVYQYKCGPNSEQKCCCDDSKKPRLYVDENVEITPELPSTLPISQLPDSSNVNDPLDLDEFYRSATPSCSNVNLKSVPPTAKRELPDSSKNCSTLDDTLNESDDNMQTENEAQKYKEKLKWQESRIKFLELKVKEKEKREMELETVKDETEVLETANAELKKKVERFEVLELEFQTNLERFKYRDAEEKTKDALERRINELEAELKNQKDDNSQLLNNICSTADDMAKIKEECKELEDRLKEKLAFSVSGVPAITNESNNSNNTLPYEIIKNILKGTPITTDEGMILRRLVVDHGAIQAILACLAIYSHQETVPSIESQNPNNSPRVIPVKNKRRKTVAAATSTSRQYWAKGTGYGTGNITPSWNHEQTLNRQRIEEQHVTVLLQILAYYINPDFKLHNRPSMVLSEMCSPDTADLPLLPIQFVELIEQSCLVPTLASYLRNDSVLDMARHIPLYRTIMALLRAMALDSQVVKFLLPPEYCAQNSSSPGTESSSLINLLKKMKFGVDTYSSTLKKTGVLQSGYPGSTPFPSTSHGFPQFSSASQEDEELNRLISDIQDTTTIVEIIISKVISNNKSAAIEKPPTPLTSSIEEIYIRIMKKLQFDSYDMISERDDSAGFTFNVAYHFEQSVRMNGERTYPARIKRLAQETVTLHTSLPCSYSSSVFVRYDTDRLDVMKVLIIGPAETPYENGCFEFDVYFPPEYPNVPMQINLQTTGRHSVRFNPNLYNDGKVCLSVLNTWQGRPEEKWNARTSSFLQVLVSIQSLILVPDPYFNEPGYEKSRGSSSGDQSSRSYNENITQATLQWAMLEQIRKPTPCFKNIINTHFYLKRKEITEALNLFIRHIENKPNSNVNIATIKRNFKSLQQEFGKLARPEGLEEHEEHLFQYAAPIIELPELQPTTSTSTATSVLNSYFQGTSYQTHLPSSSSYNPYFAAPSTSAYQPPPPLQPPANFNYQNWQSLFNLQWPSGSAGSSGSSTAPQPGSSGGLFNFF